MNYSLDDSAAMEACGGALAAACPAAVMIQLHGPLGAGKTTLVRGFLRAVGVTGAIKSPTYTLVEPYAVAGRQFYHFDLYRLEDPEALEMLGFRDYLDAGSVCLIEWPEQAAGLLPAADIDVRIEVTPQGRRVNLAAGTDNGVSLLKSFKF
ncbi:tRNA threonylcarbamoyladenosine biosynthesis protein TsaE [Methylohalomonas lacus]|uniref:tRNA threonylcarbamoyladenosine biosynthesis protein TsaE n=1 Tax=Methylohalomonas lacus TaxID=398773 RepID=A0AAE3HL21_9GAMM|nr:tRNA (adenosine(37)-N6)-threonylcarbamoyltransferase complex ATPase subunit type 1 TsaE [Methylohalomonas lacus]MCS3902387.1 tRNA threonylcarbamoyladenosine biosynthesis protein TsaE [Methylohalomonas lacus]